MKKSKNGETKSVRKKYDSLANWQRLNPVEEGGTVIRVSSKNDEDYDVTIIADGKSTFNQLYAKFKNGGQLDGSGGSGGGIANKQDVEDAVEEILNGNNITPEEQQAQQEADEANWNSIFNKAMEDAQSGQNDNG